ncbi:DUF3048 domain-containing protein [Bacillus sp. 1P06AnD]|uniref:DUF3048 domain-containing protein n=1 Tax=Bacillus sp. 1P06AnD TaxID=3132208 RepID=UPI0039A33C0D
MNVKLVACICLSSILLVAGCGKEEASNPEQPPAASDSTDAGKTAEASQTYPLSGKVVQGDAEHRSVAVMINNHPRARPQTGLQQADMVFEMLAEGNVTRFLAIYQSEFPEKVGPVRSARDYFIRIAKGMDSLYVCHGYSPEAKKLLDEHYVDSLNGLFYDGTLFKRDQSRKAPHNSYITFGNIEEGAKEKQVDMSQKPKALSFLKDHEVSAIQGEAGKKAFISYGSSDFDVVYEYDEAEGRYTRSTGGTEMVDRGTEKPVMMDNIIILSAPHAVLDDKGRRDIDFSKGGEAYLLQKGKWNRIQWQYVNQAFVFQKNGAPVSFVPGKTWVNVVPGRNGLDSTVQLD